LKIFYIAGGPAKNQPNANIFIQKRLENIKKHEIEFDVYCPVYEYKSDLKYVLIKLKHMNHFPEYDKSIENNNITYHYQIKRIGLLEFVFGYYKTYNYFTKEFLKNLKFNQYDLIHAHYGFPNGIIAKNIHRITNIPYILSLHGTDIHTLPHRSKKLKKEILESLENAKKCIFVSDHLRKQAIEIGYSDKNSVVIPNGYDPDIFYYEDKREAKNKLGFKKSKLIGFVGNLIDVKNVMILPEIFRRISEKETDTEYVIIGDGNLRKDLERRFKEYRNRNRDGSLRLRTTKNERNQQEGKNEILDANIQSCKMEYTSIFIRPKKQQNTTRRHMGHTR